MKDPRDNMVETTALSSCAIAGDSPVRRDSPRPPELRNAAYADQYDWDTLFYDVYRVGQHIVFQGPPFLNLLDPLKQSPALHGKFRWPWSRAEHVGRDKRGEIWLRDESDRILLDNPLGHFDIKVQPNLSHLFAGRRVIHTLSKNNAIRWIIDWIRFYVAEHQADGVLIYDNASTDYAAEELQGELRAAFPDIEIHVVHWPFKYGPQGGLAGAVDGQETPWDSDFCQTGSLQHARFRFLLEARSVLNADIDELVLSSCGRSIFSATEASRTQFIKFSGAWICTAGPRPVSTTDCRHADFTFRDRQEQEICPPKWCIVPSLANAKRESWSVHNLFGSKYNRRLSGEFEYRHIKGISNNWKYDRWENAAFDSARFHEDKALADSLIRAGLPAA